MTLNECLLPYFALPYLQGRQFLCHPVQRPSLGIGQMHIPNITKWRILCPLNLAYLHYSATSFESHSHINSIFRNYQLYIYIYIFIIKLNLHRYQHWPEEFFAGTSWNWDKLCRDKWGWGQIVTMQLSGVSGFLIHQKEKVNKGNKRSKQWKFHGPCVSCNFHSWKRKISRKFPNDNAESNVKERLMQFTHKLYKLL